MLTHVLATTSSHVGALVLAAAESAEVSKEIASKAGKSIALGVGAGGGAAGAGAGIGMLFGKVIEATTRQPEMKDEITSIQWLGFALTEATFFYGLVGGFIAFFL
jgi:F-type H+-transporting ATPase subunit c